jgi:hypothetical protein
MGKGVKAQGRKGKRRGRGGREGYVRVDLFKRFWRGRAGKGLGGGKVIEKGIGGKHVKYRYGYNNDGQRKGSGLHIQHVIELYVEVQRGCDYKRSDGETQPPS